MCGSDCRVTDTYDCVEDALAGHAAAVARVRATAVPVPGASE